MRVLIVGHVRPCHQALHADGHKTVLFIPRDRILPKDLAAPHDAVIALDADAPVAQWTDIAGAMHKPAGDRRTGLFVSVEGARGRSGPGSG